MITRSVIRDVVEDAGVDPGRVHWDYQGRFIYGATCLALVGGERALASFMVELGRRLERAAEDDPRPRDLTEDDVLALVHALRSDDFDHDRVFYFPGVDVHNDDDDDDDPEPDPDAARDRLLERDL